jgi:hypothetical protein
MVMAEAEDVGETPTLLEKSGVLSKVASSRAMP